MTKSNFNELIKEDPELAAGILQNSFIHIVNNMIPNIYLTKEEYKKLVGIILAGNAKDPDEVEGSDNNGDGSGEDPSTPKESVEGAGDGDDTTE